MPRARAKRSEVGRALPLLALLGPLACGGAPPAVVQVSADECVTDFDPEADYYPHKVELRHARNFTLEYRGHYKVLRTTREEGGMEDVVVLNRCGTPVPELIGELAGATVIETPVDGFASNSPASALRVRILGLEDRLAAISANPYDSVLTELAASGRVSRISAHGEPHLEGMLVLGVDAFVLWVAELRHASGLERARALGVPAVPLLSWAEPTYLGQTEWIKHHAALFEREAEAEAFFQRVESRYREIEALVAGREPVPAIWAAPNGPGRWWVEAGNWQDEVLAAAGGRNLFDEDPALGFISATTEEMVEVAQDAEVWITDFPGREALEAALPIGGIPAFGSDRVYHVHGRMDLERDAYDWYETPLVRPDLLLESLVSVLHPDLGIEPEVRILAPVLDAGEAW